MSQQVTKNLGELLTGEWTIYLYSKGLGRQVNVECLDEEGPSWGVYLMIDGLLHASLEVSNLSATKLRTLIANWVGLAS